MKQVKPLERVTDEPNAANDQSTFGDILTQFEEAHKSESGAGETTEGVVVAVGPDFVFVDIGRKTEGVIPIERFTEPSGKVNIEPGAKIIFNITGRNPEGYYELSTLKVERPKDWSAFEAAYESGAIVAGTVVEVIKGGLRVDVNGVRAFMPASRSGAKDPAEIEKLVGQEIRCRIIKLEIDSEDVVVDRRAVVEQEEKASREQKFAQLQEGATVRGTVRTVTDFGAFLDLGGVDGLLHVTDMSWTRTGKPADIVTIGDQIDVKVLKINAATKKISLGLKQLIPDPWTMAAKKFAVGDRVRGTVSRLADFGAFIELEPGVDGLIHISEMSWSKKVRKPADLLNPGDQVEVVVLQVNAEEHRISLGLKQALGDPWADIEKKFPVGSQVEGAVVNLTKFGAFIDLGEGFEGMIHIADITREKRLNHPKEAINQGQTVKAVVIELDRERRRIRLSMKALEPTSVDEYIAEHQAGETVSGRFLEVSSNKARVELGDGVVAQCRLAGESPAPEKAAPVSSPKVDLSTMSAMLNAKWKLGGGGGNSEPGAKAKEPARAGQVRSFRIVMLNPEQKKIEVELVS